MTRRAKLGHNTQLVLSSRSRSSFSGLSWLRRTIWGLYLAVDCRRKVSPYCSLSRGRLISAWSNRGDHDVCVCVCVLAPYCYLYSFKMYMLVCPCSSTMYLSVGVDAGLPMLLCYVPLLPRKYYVVDSGYPNKRGFLAPHRGCRYHLHDYRSRGRA